MKYLKTFEELSPETYMSAADKLSSMGLENRAQNIRDYVNSDYYKNFIRRLETDNEFANAVEKLKSTEEYKAFLDVVKNCKWDEVSKMLNLKAHEEDDLTTYSELSKEEKRARWKKALLSTGIGAVLAAVGAGVMAIESHLGFSNVLSAMLQGFLVSAGTLGIMTSGIAVAPIKN